MNLRKILAGVAIAGSMTLGYAGVAGAQTTTTSPSGSPTTPSHHVDCAKAEQVVTRLHQRDDAINARIAKAELRVDKLRHEGKNAQADALAKRIETIKDRLSKVEARLAKVEARLDKVCNVTPDTGSTSTTQAPPVSSDSAPVV